MDRFLDLMNQREMVETVLEDWLLRELRDELVSRITWKRPALGPVCQGLRVRADLKKPVEIYYLTPVGIGGKFFYEHPVGEALYSAECHVLVEHEEGALRTRVADGRLFWVGSTDPRGYRITEGYEDLFEKALKELQRRAL